MTSTVAVPLWLFILILLFAAVTFASHFLFPSVRWYFRRRLERAVSRLNTRLSRPIEPFKLARRQDMIQRLIYDPEVTHAIVAEAKRKGEREDVAFERARRYAREIVPSFSAFAYFGLGTRLARWLANMLYDVRADSEGDSINAIPRDATVVFVMNHRSNMDYVLVTYLAAQSSALSYAVGEWARIWPLSRLIRSMGAYFIRRKSRGPLYRKVLARYVQMATEGGVTQAIFPEGGLSLNGKLMPPKLGILSYVVEANATDVAFVPVSINYDRVLEDRVLLGASARGDRRFGVRISVVMIFILRGLWLKVTGRFDRFGQAGVVFGAPLLLSAERDPLDMAGLAQKLMERISEQMPTLSVPILADVLLQADEPLDDKALGQAVAARLASANPAPPALDGDMSSNGDMSSLLAAGLSQLEGRNAVIRGKVGWRANPAEKELLAYYARSIQSYF